MSVRAFDPVAKSDHTPAGEYWTDEELIALPDDQGQRYELQDGELLIMSPAGARHEEAGGRLFAAIFNYLEDHRIGLVYGGNAGFRLDVLTCYAPHVSFVSKERLREIRIDPDRFLKDAPDLAVEILSPGDTIRKTERKIADYFKHGTRLAWLIDLRRWQVRVYHGARAYSTLEGADALLGGEGLLSGFEYPLSKLFADPAFE